MTVPPQALGISPGGQGPAVAVPEPASSPAVVAPPPSPAAPVPPPPPPSPAILSSRTMEQLAEFDSILESKFQFNSSLNQSNSITIIKAEQPAEATVPLQTAVAALASAPDSRSLR